MGCETSNHKDINVPPRVDVGATIVSLQEVLSDAQRGILFETSGDVDNTYTTLGFSSNVKDFLVNIWKKLLGFFKSVFGRLNFRMGKVKTDLSMLNKTVKTTQQTKDKLNQDVFKRAFSAHGHLFDSKLDMAKIAQNLESATTTLQRSLTGFKTTIENINLANLSTFPNFKDDLETALQSSRFPPKLSDDMILGPSKGENHVQEENLGNMSAMAYKRSEGHKEQIAKWLSHNDHPDVTQEEFLAESRKILPLLEKINRNLNDILFRQEDIIAILSKQIKNSEQLHQALGVQTPEIIETFKDLKKTMAVLVVFINENCNGMVGLCHDLISYYRQLLDHGFEYRPTMDTQSILNYPTYVTDVGPIDGIEFDEEHCPVTLLSLEQALEKLDYQDVLVGYNGIYTTHGLIDSAKEIGQKIIDHLISIYRWLTSRFSGGAKIIAAKAEAVKRTLSETKQVKDTGVISAEAYHRILLKCGYTLNGNDPLEKTAVFIQMFNRVLNMLEDTAKFIYRLNIETVVKKMVAAMKIGRSDNDTVRELVANFENFESTKPKNITDFYVLDARTQKSIQGITHTLYTVKEGKTIPQLRKEAFEHETPHIPDTTAVFTIADQGLALSSKAVRLFESLEKGIAGILNAVEKVVAPALKVMFSKNLKLLSALLTSTATVFRNVYDISKNIFNDLFEFCQMVLIEIRRSPKANMDFEEHVARYNPPKPDHQHYPTGGTTMFSLATALREQVTQQSLGEVEEPISPQYPSELSEEDTLEYVQVEDPSLTESCAELINQRELFEQANKNTRAELRNMLDTQETMLSLGKTIEYATKSNTLTEHGLFFAQKALGSRLYSCGIPESVGHQMVDLQGWGETASGLLGSLAQVGTHVVKTVAAQAEVLHEHTAHEMHIETFVQKEWSQHVLQTLGVLEQRVSGLQAQVSHAGPEAGGQPLSATKDNVALAEFLFTGRGQNHDMIHARAENALEKLAVFEKTITGYTHGGALHTFTMFASNFTHNTEHTDIRLDGRVLLDMVNQFRHISSEHQPMGTGGDHYVTPEFFKGSRLDIIVPKIQPHMTYHDLVHFGSIFNIQEYKHTSTQKATKQTWRDFVIPSLNKTQMTTLLQQLRKLITQFRQICKNVIASSDETENQVINIRKMLMMPQNATIARSGIHAAFKIWCEYVHGLGALISIGLKAIDHLLSYVSSSLKGHPTFKDMLKNNLRNGKGVIAGGAAGTIGFSLGGAVGMGFAMHQKNPAVAIGQIVSGVAGGTALGTAAGVGISSIIDNHRRKAWDKTIG